MHLEVQKLFDLSGKVAVITGGARNLGYDAACVLAGAGCDLALSSRTLADAERSAVAIHDKYGVDTLALQLDQADAKQVDHMVEQVIVWKDRIDVLVNNAGGGSGDSPARLIDRSIADIDQLIKVNLNGVLYCCRAVGRSMVQQRRGKIINIASIAGLLGRDRRMYDRNSMVGQPVDYAAAKAGVIGMTMDLAGYLSPMGVRVNAISPGGFHGATRTVPEKFVGDYSDRTPLGHMGTDGLDLNGAVLFLASPASDYVTGQNLVVDGGFSIWH